MSKRPPKLTAIATSVAGTEKDVYVRTIALDEHGRAWEYNNNQRKWNKLPPLPEEEE